jgi:hypothetical protein
MVECDSDSSTAIETIIHVHLAVWTIACIIAFLVYYCRSEVRHNQHFEGQLHTLSGVIVYNKPLFGTLMCGFGGAVLVAVTERITETCDWLALLILIVLFCSLLSVVNYDVHDYRIAHFVSLGVLVAFGTWFVVWVGVRPLYVSICYYGITFVFLFMLALNRFYMNWVPPFMTLQALAEIAWVMALCVCILVFSLEE